MRDMKSHPSTRSRRHQPSPKCAPARGFTLIELMVAMTGSLFFTIFVFMLSRDVAKFFQSQSRTSDTTLAAISGFERLRADIARAGFLASPNLVRDANRCPRTPSGGAISAPPQQVGTDLNSYPGLQKMTMLGVDASPTSITNLPFYATYNNAKINPDVLTLYGNYATTEQFPVRSIDFTNNPVSIILEQDSPALLRVGIATLPTATKTSDAAGTAILNQIFKPGTILRVVDESNREQYAIIKSANYASDLATLTIENSVQLQRKGSGNTCGIHAHAAGLVVNPVNIIRYAITDVKSSFATNHPQLSFLYDGAAPSYDDTRLDLMRYEVPPSLDRGASLIGVNWPGTSTRITAMGELVAEYAVDLAFGLTVLSNYQTGALTTLDETDDLRPYAGNPLSTSEAGGTVTLTQTRGAHFIRGAHARLVVRYREADRETSILPNPAASTVSAEQLVRVKVSAGQEYARTRSFRGHVTTRNTQNLMWN